MKWPFIHQHSALKSKTTTKKGASKKKKNLWKKKKEHYYGLTYWLPGSQA